MQTVILHVGSPKTGSTYLQNTLAKNRERLKEYGIAYHGIHSSLCANHWWFALPYFSDYSSYGPVKTDIANGIPLQMIKERGLDSQFFFKKNWSYLKLW